MNQLRLIKITVFTFTFLLIFGSLVLMSRLYQKLTTDKTAQTLSDISLGLPPKTSIRQITADGGLLYILVTDNESNERIIIFNPEKSKIISNMTLN